MTMHISTFTPAEPQGQSEAAKAFVARRQAADRAIAAADARHAERERQARAELQARTGENPLLLMAGIVLTVAALTIGLWWYIGTARCDPMISDRAYSAECRLGL
jgi:hypothetical protein